MKQVHLGFEVGTGAPIEVPVCNTVVTGQTQRAGKTTALEAMVARAGVRAISFITKRGEGSFADQPRIRPFFRERADWQFVEAILEQAMRQRMRFERAWVVRAARDAKTLADVRENVRALGGKAKRSMDQDIYMLLGEYLDSVIPEIARANFDSKLRLGPGLSVMDLAGLQVGTQGLVIASVMGRVIDEEDHVVTILPEAWEHIPESRGSVVSLVAAQLARKGSALMDLLWIDTQDLAGTKKEIVRQCPLYLLGVQREANEVKRTLGHIPGGLKRPRADDVATLKLGQFYACWDDRVVKVYVQPEWMTPDEARAIAVGTIVIPSRRGTGEIAPAPVPPEEPEPLEANPEPEQTEETESEDEMNPSQEDKLDRILARLDGGAAVSAERPPAAPGAPADEEAIYQRILARLKKEAPAILKVLAVKPGIEVAVVQETIEVDGKTLRGRLARLIADGWFEEPKTGSAAYTEFQRRGFATSKPNVYKELDTLAALGFVTKEADGYRAVEGMRINIKGGK